MNEDKELDAADDIEASGVGGLCRGSRYCRSAHGADDLTSLLRVAISTSTSPS